jgi:hypothetical protein
VPFCRRNLVGAFWGGSGAHALFGEEKRTEVAAKRSLGRLLVVGKVGRRSKGKAAARRALTGSGGHR